MEGIALALALSFFARRQRNRRIERERVAEREQAASKQAEREAEQARVKAEALHRRQADIEAAALRAEHIAAWSNSITTMRDVRRAAWRAIDDLA